MLLDCNSVFSKPHYSKSFSTDPPVGPFVGSDDHIVRVVNRKGNACRQARVHWLLASLVFPYNGIIYLCGLMFLWHGDVRRLFRAIPYDGRMASNKFRGVHMTVRSCGSVPKSDVLGKTWRNYCWVTVGILRTESRGFPTDRSDLVLYCIQGRIIVARVTVL